ncbi:unnamed protein product [Trichogramma brassicae]|uniref:Uncharacterized protein n=1 Tax=Trichogramma brassicae TaxID=86971 RepID=A0A6H5IRZ6_9HYME|nr:unnamed protein product [Trichogramma brassicae]
MKCCLWILLPLRISLCTPALTADQLPVSYRLTDQLMVISVRQFWRKITRVTHLHFEKPAGGYSPCAGKITNTPLLTVSHLSRPEDLWGKENLRVHVVHKGKTMSSFHIINPNIKSLNKLNTLSKKFFSIHRKSRRVDDSPSNDARATPLDVSSSSSSVLDEQSFCDPELIFHFVSRRNRPVRLNSHWFQSLQFLDRPKILTSLSRSSTGDKNKNNDKVVHFQEPGGGEDPDKNRQEPKDSEDDDLDWYVQMQETSMRNELLLETVNRNTNDMQKILKGLLQAVHSTHELNKNMVEQQSKMNSNLNTLATSIQSLSITFRGEKARQRQYREKNRHITK